MESVIFEGSPLAAYLEGRGEGEGEDESFPTDAHARLDPSESPSFAPRGPSTAYIKFRRKLPRPLKLEIPPSRSTVARFHDACSSALNSRLGRSENAHFLEQFRYTIVASQLINDHTNLTSYNPLRQSNAEAVRSDEDHAFQFTWKGLCSTSIAAFAVAWLIHFARKIASRWGLTLIVSILVLPCTILYRFFRRQWLQYLRKQAIEAASALVSNAQSFDAATSAAITLVQEVELISRGYRISHPLPPITRLEEQSQTRRCMRLRRALRTSIMSLLAPYAHAYNDLKLHAVGLDLEKYYDIYEISQSDIEEFESIVMNDESTSDDGETLKALKIGLHRLHIIRKLFLCSLLALNADGGKLDFSRWAIAVELMQCLSSKSAESAEGLDDILSEEGNFVLPPTPKLPVTPGRERMRAQMRKLGSLSQGIRGLQAKMHILREESDKALDESSDISELGTSLITQYDSIGADLKNLMQEWEDGKAALVTNIDRNERRMSLSSLGIGPPRSPTLSLGGLTAVGGSPSDALKILNGEDLRSSSTEITSSDEEIFEAIALPRQRSILTREERIAKMKEDRLRQAFVREKTDASTHMLKELETNSRKMLEARLEQANLLKKVVEAIKDLVQDCNFDCNDSGIALQAMDNSHVALVSMMLKAESFSPFRCDRNVALGINLTSLTKVLRCAQNEDILTLKAEDAPDVINLVFESAESDRLSEYDIKLMDIDQEHLGIPETEYAATISMPSAEFQKICRDLMALSESVAIEATKEGVKFACTGDIGNGSVTLRSHNNVDKPDLNVDIELTEPVALTFSLKYLVNFCKASGLSGQVKLCLSNEVPLLVEYALVGSSYLRFYLAPKIGDEE